MIKIYFLRQDTFFYFKNNLKIYTNILIKLLFLYLFFNKINISPRNYKLNFIIF